MPTARTTPRSSARERLLSAADELFYAEGVHTVGVDRVIEHAGVSRASFYNNFASKEQLIHEYLARRREQVTERLSAAVAAEADPRRQILAVFASQAESMTRPSFRGCAFVAASTEEPPGGAFEEDTTAYRRWFRELFTDLSRAAGAGQPELLGRQLHLLYDGAAVTGGIEHEPDTGPMTLAAVEALLDAALPSEQR